MKKLLASIVTAILCLTVFCFPASAEWERIKVKIAPFYTEIDYMSVDNRYVEYPLITYKDITYFPMTFDLCGRLGLISTYTDEDGLFITRTTTSFDVNGNYFGSSAKNSYNTKYDAYIPEYPVYLNGIYIDNKKEEYPLINFRGITYFPMTWRFAYEELSFDVEWSEKDYSFKLYHNGNSSSGIHTDSADGNKVYLSKYVSVYDESVNENGDITNTLSHSYNENYVFDTEFEIITRLEDTTEYNDDMYNNNYGKVESSLMETSLKNSGVYAGNTLLMQFDSDKDVTDAYAYEYKLDGSSVIDLTIFIGNAPAPYTERETILLSKNGNTVKELQWDKGDMFSAIYKAENGNYYICSTGHSMGSSRYVTQYSDVYLYTPKTETLASMVEKYSDKVNSIKAIGMTDGKLYVQAMWYKHKKHEYSPTPVFSAINSGYYEIDVETGEMTRLYPYILGETFVAPNGTLYCIGTYSRVQRIINLNTGKIIPVQ